MQLNHKISVQLFKRLNNEKFTKKLRNNPNIRRLSEKLEKWTRCKSNSILKNKERI
jgi:hypothetical protein